MGSALDYRGVDNSPAMLAIASGRYPGVDFRSGDALALPYRDHQFPLACAFEVFGHMPDCGPAIAELVRLAKEKAIFSLWTDVGDGIRDGGEHYIYGTRWVDNVIADVCAKRPHSIKKVWMDPVTVIVISFPENR